MQIQIEFKPQDCWVGVFWKRTHYAAFTTRFGWSVPRRRMTDVWICLVPMLPLHISWCRAC
jgi:hypothetical protein